MHVSELQTRHVSELLKVTEQHGVENANRLRKQDLVFAIVRQMMKQGESLTHSGTLEILPDGFGFLRSADISYLAGPDDIYVSPNQVRRFNLHTSDAIEGSMRAPKDNERYFALVRLDSINCDDPEACKHKVLFENLTPLFPTKQFKLEHDIKAKENLINHAINLVSPIGRGQCALLVVPPKTGKTVMLRNIAHATTTNCPDVELITLLIDERPEEVTKMSRPVRGKVVSPTFDEPARRHVQVTEMVIGKAERMVEYKKDMVILLDSITRPARAYNAVVPTSDRVLTGGVDTNALHRPKRFFGAARSVEEGGSLTIIATALVEAGSHMNDVVYEEFKSTDNMELHLDRRMAEKRLLPVININKSDTRRRGLLVPNDQLQHMWLLRKFLHPMDEIEATEFLVGKLEDSKNNNDLFELMRDKQIRPGQGD